MNAKIYIEGGGYSKELHVRCRQGNALPSLNDVESRPRNAIQDSLVQATRRCKAGYVKGKRSFQIVARLDPESLREYLPSFQRFERVLKEKL